MLTAQIDKVTGRVTATVSPPVNTPAPPGLIFMDVDETVNPVEAGWYLNPTTYTFQKEKP